MCGSEKAKVLQAEVVSVLPLPGLYCRLKVRLPETIPCDAGQFFNLKTGGEPEPLWRRPLSVFDQNEDIVEFYVRVVGRGTQWLSKRQPGDRLNLIGPLGRGFTLPENREPSLLVAGGVGIAPLCMLARRLSERGLPLRVLWGGATQDAVQLGMETPWELMQATLDGSVGYQGMVTDLLGKFLEQKAQIPRVYSCGPEPMLRQVARICASEETPVQLCFEAKMACGWGVCLGCVVAVDGGQGDIVYKRVCVDGPVFWGHELAEW